MPEGRANWEMVLTTLVLALTVCYTGLEAKVSYPCMQVMAKLYEPLFPQYQRTAPEELFARIRRDRSQIQADSAEESGS
jgi:hypothetical protein